MEKKKVILIGAGLRGLQYTNIMFELADRYEVIAVAEPIEDRREYIRKKHNIPEELCFTTWEPLLELPKLADAAIIANMDRAALAKVTSPVLVSSIPIQAVTNMPASLPSHSLLLAL